MQELRQANRRFKKPRPETQEFQQRHRPIKLLQLETQGRKQVLQAMKDK